MHHQPQRSRNGCIASSRAEKDYAEWKEIWTRYHAEHTLGIQQK